MEISERIKRWRESRKFTKAELGRRVGKSRAAVVQWEKGQSKPSRETTEVIARALKVSLSKFWGTPPRAKRSA